VVKTIKTSDKLSKICEQLFAWILPKVMPKKRAAERDITFMILKFERTNQRKICCKETIATDSDSSKNRLPEEKSPQNQNQKSN
jgi:hypothetical protein